MKLTLAARILALAVLALASTQASAHVGVHTGGGFAGGLAHPFLGLDHLLAMLAVGLWAAQQGGRALWAVPAAFVAAMLAGGALAWSGFAPSQDGLVSIEGGIAASVLVLGLLIATRQRWSLAYGMALAAAFALFHGYAHGLEMPGAAAPALYAAGFALATATLHGVGMAGLLAGRRALQLAGVGIAAAGVALMLGA